MSQLRQEVRDMNVTLVKALAAPVLCMSIVCWSPRVAI